MKISSRAELRQKIKEINDWLPMLTREQILYRAVERYYNRHLMIKSRRMPHIRQILLEQQKFQCIYCEKNLTFKEATVDHIKPVARGGINSRENLCVACDPCNNTKGTMNAEEFAVFQVSTLSIPIIPDISLL